MRGWVETTALGGPVVSGSNPSSVAVFFGFFLYKNYISDRMFETLPGATAGSRSLESRVAQVGPESLMLSEDSVDPSRFASGCVSVKK